MTATKLNPQDDPNMVWDIFQNAWVTREYWRWVNGGSQTPSAQETAR